MIAPRIHEMTEGDPLEIVEQNAIAKAKAVAMEAPGAVVIAGDTEVALDGRALGQPAGPGDAAQFLRALSGKEHEVLGGVAIRDASGVRSGTERSIVRFHEISAEFAQTYIASGEWENRAGGYAIQSLGSALIEAVEGDLANVIGLPVGLLLRLAPELLPSTAE
jgi:septum formation protein